MYLHFRKPSYQLLEANFKFDIMMWKGKNSSLKTANLCNEFLVEYLARKKQQLQKTGLQRKAFVYHGAIASIKKYPLPIISAQQLKIIHGVGELLCEELTKVIKHHYRDFLRKHEQGAANQNQEADTEPKQRKEEGDENSVNRSNSKSMAHTTNVYTKNQQNSNNDDDSKRDLSVKSATMEREYHPRAKSQAAYMMAQISKLGKGEYLSEQILKQVLKKDYSQTTGKQYVMAMSNLIKYGYIQRDAMDVLLIKLTEKGVNELEKLENKTKIKDSQAKIQGLLNSFKDSHALKRNVEERPERNVRQLIQTRYENQLILVIDSRQIKQRQEQCFFETRLQDKYGIPCKSANLPLGDFVWLYDGKVLDYIIQRKKADDLISSIFDGRYKQQKYRLKNSGFTNIYYLFEGHLTGTNAMSEKQVASALMKTRVKDGFKVVTAKNITQSIKFLTFMTQSIRNKLNTSAEICTLGTLEQFTSNNAKSSNLTIQHIFGLSLKTIPGVGKNSVSEILKYFSSFRCLYDQLKLLPSRLQRVQFLRELLKGGGVQRTVPELLVDLLFDPPKK